MAIFDESEVVAGHEKFATLVKGYVEEIAASTDLIRKAVLFADRPRTDPEEHADFLAGSQLILRIVNNAGACSVLCERGYFIQAAAQLRDIAEIAMLVLVFSEEYTKLRHWRKLEGETRYKEYNRSKLNKMLSQNASKKYYDWFNLYFDLYSEYGTHPTGNSIIFHYEGNSFNIGPHVNKNLYVNLYADLSVLVIRATDICFGLWNNVLKDDIETTFPKELARYRAVYR